MTEFHFLQPLDVLYLRGNRLFADASTPSDALMPPWPSMAAGALRSQILTTQGIDAGQFSGEQPLPEKLARSLGTVKSPGSFRISHFLLARVEDGMVQDIYHPLPADCLVTNNRSRIQHLQPRRLSSQIQCSAPCGQVPVLRTDKQVKPDSGLWLNKAGIQAWLDARSLEPEHLVESSQLWQVDPRLGIALDGTSRTAIKSQLYTVDTVAVEQNIGFLVGVDGADGLIPEQGILRLGGDGRGAEHVKLDWKLLEPDWRFIENSKRFRMCLTTPGLFEQGWLPPGIHEKNGQLNWEIGDFSAQLVSASVPRSGTVSGWDIAANKPKLAMKSVSAGSVYWFDQFEGDVAALGKLAREGLFSVSAYPDAKRRAEGFNNIMIAAWPY